MKGLEKKKKYMQIVKEMRVKIKLNKMKKMIIVNKVEMMRKYIIMKK